MPLHTPYSETPEIYFLFHPFFNNVSSFSSSTVGRELCPLTCSVSESSFGQATELCKFPVFETKAVLEIICNQNGYGYYLILRCKQQH